MARGELIAEGAYQYQDGTETLGHETWQLSRLGHGGLIISTRIDLIRPNTESWIVSYELTGNWAPRGLSVRIEREDGYMRTEQRAEKKNWVARVESPKGVQDFTLDLTPQHEICFNSPLFETVALVRSGLAVGQTRELETIAVQFGSLAPVPDHETYTCISEDKIQVPAGTFSAFKYERKQSAETGKPPVEMWADTRGIILRQAAQPGPEARLTRYRWVARR